MNNIPGVEFSKKKKNPRIDSDASSFAIDYYKDADYFSNLDNFVKFIKDVERSVRRSKYYKQYIAYLKNDLGLDFCQVLSNVKPDSEDAYTKIEMHHGPILTLFDCVAIVLDHYINTGKKITTFRIAKAIIDEHFELNIQTVNLCETVHEQVHENNVFLNMKMGFGDINTFLNKYSEGIRYNEELKTKNTLLEEELRQLEVIQAENSTLKEYLNLTEQYKSYKTVPAYVINKDISNYSSIFVINAGKDNGIEEKMTVIAAEGLVGYVISVTADTAKVQTLVDPSNVVSATLENSKDNVICRGTLNKNELKTTYISTDTVLTEGEKLYTSGMGGIYPKGIYVGTIKTINETKNITDRSFITKSAVDFENLETVLVITNNQ